MTLLFADKRQHFCNQCLIKPTNGFDLSCISQSLLMYMIVLNVPCLFTLCSYNPSFACHKPCTWHACSRFSFMLRIATTLGSHVTLDCQWSRCWSVFWRPSVRARTRRRAVATCTHTRLVVSLFSLLIYRSAPDWLIYRLAVVVKSMPPVIKRCFIDPRRFNYKPTTIRRRPSCTLSSLSPWKPSAAMTLL